MAPDLRVRTEIVRGGNAARPLGSHGSRAKHGRRARKEFVRLGLNRSRRSCESEREPPGLRVRRYSHFQTDLETNCGVGNLEDKLLKRVLLG